jgi:hypothetical protein
VSYMEPSYPIYAYVKHISKLTLTITF